MKFPGPHVRYRLYTSLRSYLWFLRYVFSGRKNSPEVVTRFERAIETMFGASNAVAVSMARMGIYYAVKHLIRPGREEVVMSPYTIADVVNVVRSAGGVPVFADIERETCNIDPARVRELIGERTGVVLITHLHGVPAKVREIAAICEERGVPLVEDAAQAFGAIVDGKRLGTFGRAGVFSLGTYKNINSWFGGLVVTEDRELAAKVRAELEPLPYQKATFIFKKLFKGLITDLITLPAVFKSFTFWLFRFGFLHDVEAINKRVRTELDVSRRDHLLPQYQTKLTSFQARLAHSQLEGIDRGNVLRNEKGGQYYAGLKGLPGLIMPTHNDSSIYTYFPVQFEDRERFLKYLMFHGCDVAAQHLKNTADLPGFKPWFRDCPNARATADQTVILPSYPRYPSKDIQRNIQVIRDFFANEVKSSSDRTSAVLTSEPVPTPQANSTLILSRRIGANSN